MKRHLPAAIFSAALLTAVLLIGCTVPGPEPGRQPASDSAVKPAAQAGGPAAPDFTVTALGGSEFTLSKHRGKVVILYAMAAWCPTCGPEANALGRIFREHKGRGVEVLILDVWPGDTEDQLLQFKSFARGGDHLWALDKDNRWASAYQIRALDTTIIVDRQGRVAYRDEVPTSYEKLTKELERVL